MCAKTGFALIPATEAKSTESKVATVVIDSDQLWVQTQARHVRRINAQNAVLLQSLALPLYWWQ